MPNPKGTREGGGLGVSRGAQGSKSRARRRRSGGGRRPGWGSGGERRKGRAGSAESMAGGAPGLMPRGLAGTAFFGRRGWRDLEGPGLGTAGRGSKDPTRREGCGRSQRQRTRRVRSPAAYEMA